MVAPHSIPGLAQRDLSVAPPPLTIMPSGMGPKGALLSQIAQHGPCMPLIPKPLNPDPVNRGKSAA